MLRIGLLVLAMIVIIQTPESMHSLHAYKDYLLALLLSLLIKPWLENQLD